MYTEPPNTANLTNSKLSIWWNIYIYFHAIQQLHDTDWQLFIKIEESPGKIEKDSISKVTLFRKLIVLSGILTEELYVWLCMEFNFTS